MLIDPPIFVPARRGWRWISLPGSLRSHLSKLRPLSLQEQWSYCLRYLHEKGRRLRRTAWTLRHDWNLGPHNIVLDDPDLIREFATISYCPEPFAGRTVLFQSAGTYTEGARWTIEARWRSALGNTLVTHTIPGDHESVFIAPDVDRLARSLTAALLDAQAAAEASASGPDSRISP